MDADRLTQLESSLRSPALDQRKAALDELARSPSELAIPILQRLAADPDFLCRRLAVMGLGNHRTEASFQLLQDLLARETDDNVLAEIANSLFEFGEKSVPLLQQLFQRHRHWITRQTILSILMEADQDDVLLAVIREALQDETQTVKETGILALGNLLDRPFHAEALTLLTALAQAEFWRDRWRAATALTRTADPQAQLILTKLQQDPNHYVVAAALESAMPKER